MDLFIFILRTKLNGELLLQTEVCKLVLANSGLNAKNEKNE